MYQENTFKILQINYSLTQYCIQLVNFEVHFFPRLGTVLKSQAK